MLPRLILASQSPGRRQVLAAAGLSFSVEPSYFDEDQIQTSDPVELVQTLAYRKAEVVAKRQTEPSLVIGADSIFWLQGQIYGKPQDPEAAWQCWQQMRGEVGDLYTGHALIDTSQGRHVVHHGLTRIFFARPTDAEIRAYIATGEPLGCAGSVAINGYGGMLIERIEGCHTNVIGLSMPLLRHLMHELGYTLTDFWQQSPAQGAF